MPKTKLGNKIEKARAAEARRKAKALATRQAKTDKVKTHLTSPDWIKFCDTCFEFYIRYRDNWIDTLDGKIFRQGDYEGYHACHYIGRGNMATRYLDINCHGQSQNYNFLMSPSNMNARLRRNIQIKYRNFLVRKYGEETVKDLEARANENCPRSEYDWTRLAIELYGMAAAMDSRRLEERLAKVFEWTRGKRTLELIRKKIIKECNDD